MRVTLIALIIMCTTSAYAGKLEAEYRDMFCQHVGGETEVRLADGTRVDCLTNTHAWEIDRANKWAEAIGQSLHYAHMTKKKAGILLFDKGADKMRMRIDDMGLGIDVLVVEE